MDLAHFYHAWCNGDWEHPVLEYCAAVGGEPVHLGLVGGPQERANVAAYVGSRNRDVKVVAEERYGWEQVTLVQVAAYAACHGGAVLYAHTKSDRDWRVKMMEDVVLSRARCLARLEEGYDVAGTYWRMEPDPHFSGNFWMATCAYIRTLPPIRHTNRHDAEKWIGLGNPRA
jgi:hypothetical protein